MVAVGRQSFPSLLRDTLYSTISLSFEMTVLEFFITGISRLDAGQSVCLIPKFMQPPAISSKSTGKYPGLRAKVRESQLRRQ